MKLVRLKVAAATGGGGVVGVVSGAAASAAAVAAEEALIGDGSLLRRGAEARHVARGARQEVVELERLHRLV